MGGPLNVSYQAVTLEQTWSKLKGISYDELLLLEAVCRTLSILALSTRYTSLSKGQASNITEVLKSTHV